MNQEIEKVCRDRLDAALLEIIISNSCKKNEINKIKIRPLFIQKELYFQASEYRGTKIFHHNYKKEELLIQIEKWVDGIEKSIPKIWFRQIEIRTIMDCVTILISKKGKVNIKIKTQPDKSAHQMKPEQPDKSAHQMKSEQPDKSAHQMKLTQQYQQEKQTLQEQKPLNIFPEKEQITSYMPCLSHNRVKNYLLKEYIPIPFLIDLGVMTKEGKIVQSKYDKFKQINRFLEFIEDILPSLPKNRELTMIDFGCGKSYLTFAMYYYLKELKGYPIKIIGLDLKADVIKKCNDLSDQYGYENLKFLHGDIASYERVEQVDMVVTLHACDTATDYALYKAVKWNAKVILSVPCCQHEVNEQLSCKELESILKYGLIKERTAALLTDALRANLLESQGYKTQLLEFIDIEHTPKNILIRAVKTKTKDIRNQKSEQEKSYQEITAFLGICPTLGKLLEEDA